MHSISIVLALACAVTPEPPRLTHVAPGHFQAGRRATIKYTLEGDLNEVKGLWIRFRPQGQSVYTLLFFERVQSKGVFLIPELSLKPSETDYTLEYFIGYTDPQRRNIEQAGSINEPLRILVKGVPEASILESESFEVLKILAFIGAASAASVAILVLRE